MVQLLETFKWYIDRAIQESAPSTIRLEYVYIYIYIHVDTSWIFNVHFFSCSQQFLPGLTFILTCFSSLGVDTLPKRSCAHGRGVTMGPWDGKAGCAHSIIAIASKL